MSDKNRNPAAEWSRLMFDASGLGADARMVVALRSWRIMAGGPAATRELERIDVVDTSREIREMSRIVFPDPAQHPLRQTAA